MDISAARTLVATLKAGDTFDLGGAPFEVTSKDCGVVEFCRPQFKDITGSYFRASIEDLAIRLSIAN